jgi:carboxylesterase type B
MLKILLGPAVDGSYVTDLPNRILAKRPSRKTALVGHNANEGRLFVDPKITTDSAFNNYLSDDLFLHMQPNSLNYVINVLYPPEYDGSKPYTTVQERLSLLIGEAFIGCSAYTVAEQSETSFAYVFDVPPGLHGEDIAYSFFTPGKPSPNVKSKSTATEMQGYLARFATTGNPNHARPPPTIPEYHPGKKVLCIKDGGFLVSRDDMASKRCAWWEKNLTQYGGKRGFKQQVLDIAMYASNISK